MSKQCRTCSNSTEECRLLDSLAFDEFSFAELLKEVANINIMEDTNRLLPQHICASCSRRLKLSHTFIKQAQEVNRKLCAVLELKRGIDDGLEEFEIDIRQCINFDTENNEVDNHNINEIPAGAKCGQSEKQHSMDSAENKVDVENCHTLLWGIKEEKEENKLDSLGALKLSPYKIEFSASDDDEVVSLPGHGTNNEKYVKVETLSEPDSDTDIAVPCIQCNKIFKNSRKLSQHLRNAHVPEDQKCACPVCGAKFTRSCNMYKHMRTFHEPDSVLKLLPTKEKTHECKQCNRKYTKMNHLKYHIKNKHENDNKTNSDELRTQQLNKDLSKKSTTQQLKKDLSKKSTVRPLCSICGGSFYNKAHLTVHMRRHTGEKPFKCDLCDKAYPSISELTSHRRIHTGEKPFKCKICDKAFRVCAKLASHMRSHTDERPYNCSHCERTFKYSKDLNIHTRTHTGERPYSCSVCSSSFTQSNTLKAHQMKLGHTENIT